MNKKILLLAIPTLLISGQTFALNKVMDLYPNANRYTVEGNVKDFDDLITVNNNSINILNGNENTYVSINDAMPNYIKYNDQPVNMYDLLSRHIGEKIKYKDEFYKITSVQNDGVWLFVEKDNENIFIKNYKNIKVSNDWLNKTQKGLFAEFNNNIVKNDYLFVTQQEQGISYTNNYIVNIKDTSNLDITHYLQINNGTGKIYKDMNLNFYISDINVNKRPIFYKANMLQMRASADVESAQEPSFEMNNNNNIKSLSLNNKIDLGINLNKIKYKTDSLKYKEKTILSIDDNFINNVLSNNINELSNTKEYENLNKDYENNLNKKVKEYVLNQYLNESNNLFKDYIIVENKDKLYPQGAIEVYDKNKNGIKKLIVSDNINLTENKDIKLFKKNNNDLIIKDFDITIIKKEYKENASPNPLIKYKYIAYFKNITIENRSEENYNIYLNEKEHLIKGKETIKIEY